jgi:hypothetical protein
MNKTLLKDPLRYPEIVVWWNADGSESQLRLVDKTIGEAYNTAIKFGYRPPVWYKPWQYFTGGIGMMTIGFGTNRFY